MCVCSSDQLEGTSLRGHVGSDVPTLLHPHAEPVAGLPWVSGQCLGEGCELGSGVLS